MNIGIMGAGNVGGTLGKRWSAGGDNLKPETVDFNWALAALPTPRKTHPG